MADIQFAKKAKKEREMTKIQTFFDVASKFVKIYKYINRLKMHVTGLFISLFKKNTLVN